MNYPAALKYSKSHEWVKEEDGVYYWAQTIDGKTTILEVDGQKLRVTAEVTPPPAVGRRRGLLGGEL